jgi:hypothetical protein
LAGLRLGNASIESSLGMGFDGAIRCGEGHAGEHEAGRDLVLIEEGLILLVHGATDQLAGTGGTGASAARDGQINVLLRCRIKDRLVIGAVDGAVQAFVGIDEGDLVGGHGSRGGKGESSLNRFVGKSAAARCRRPSPHLGRLCPHMGGASSGLSVDSEDLSRDPRMPMETMLSEIVLVALLLAVVVVSGKA